MLVTDRRDIYDQVLRDHGLQSRWYLYLKAIS